MNFRYSRFLTALFFLSLVTPALARMNSAMLTFEKPVHMGSTMLQPGSYQIRAAENAKEVEVVKDGKIVAQIQCHWVQLDKKAQGDSAVVDNDVVHEIRFEGRTAAAQFD